MFLSCVGVCALRRLALGCLMLLLTISSAPNSENGVTYVRANPAAPFTTGEKVRRLAMVTTAVMAIAAVCLVLGGSLGKEPKSLAAKHAATAPIYHRTTGLDEEGEASDSKESAIPDPEEAKRKAAEAFSKAT